MERLIIFGIGAYLVWNWLNLKRIETIQPLPAGAVPTGRVQRTTNTGAPGTEETVVGFAIRDWAEIRMPSGDSDWVELRVKNPF